MIETSKALFEDFLERVVRTHVFSDPERARADGPLTEKSAKDVASGRRIDDRTPYLMTVSGKGGYVPGPGFADRSPYRNITLLDHLISVARGAAVFAEIDLRASGVVSGLESRIALIIATGFLHDADKMLGMSRSEGLTPDHVEGLMSRYGVHAYLEAHGAAAPAGDMLTRINAVEMTRSDLLRPGMRLLSPQERGDMGYVRLADRLEGHFLDSRKGADLMIDELKGFGGFRSEALRQGWRKIHMRAPHTPFLLSNFQLGLSAAVRSIFKMPPLIETLHDGEFLAIIPEAGSDRVIEAAIADAVRPFGLRMRPDTNARGSRDLLDGRGGAAELIEALENNPRDAAKALFVQVDHLQGPGDLRGRIDEMTAPFNLMPDFGGLGKFAGKHYQPWPDRGSDAEGAWLRPRAAAIAIGIGCTEPTEKGLAERVPDAAQREAELTGLLDRYGHEVPGWFEGLGKLSRQTLLGVLAAGLAASDPDLEADLLDRDGLLDLWLVGDGSERAGLTDKIGDPGAEMAEAAKGWFRSLIGGGFTWADETILEGRCHFTNMPVRLTDKIDGKSGLDGVKVSAFSGREGRPESHTSSKSQTLVSPIAFAEHRLRTLQEEGAGFGSVPAHISSPSSLGLFASLQLRDERSFLEINQFDLMRLEEKGEKRPVPVTDMYGQRIFFARHFALPEKQIEIIQQIRMMMRSALRMGRPVHVFRGLPSPQNAFFHIDAAPDLIRRAIGGGSLRIEQIPDAIETLKLVEELADMNSVGPEVAMRFADPETRFGAACEALVAIDRLPEDKQKQKTGLRWRLTNITRDKEIRMSQNENVLIAFAQAMAGIQEAPRRDASNSVKTMGLRIALEAVEGCRNDIHQTGRESLIAAVAGMMQNEFERAGRVNWIGKPQGNPFPTRRATEAATLFVDEVWAKAFSGRSPASKARRIATAVYQIAFENEHRRRFDERRANEPATTETL
jgi:hypothetical protein